MKKFCTFFVSLIIFSASALTAATQYGWNSTPAADTPDYTARADIKGLFDKKLVVTAEGAGTDSFLILNNNLKNSIFGGVETDIGYTLTRNGHTTYYSLSSELKQIAEDGSGVISAGTTFKKGDSIVFFRDGIVVLDPEVATADKPKSSNPNYSSNYGLNRYYQFDYNTSAYNGTLDLVFFKTALDPKYEYRGGPLPGVFTTLAVGSITALIFNRRRKKPEQE